jgi:hypothetical protein
MLCYCINFFLICTHQCLFFRGVAFKKKIRFLIIFFVFFILVPCRGLEHHEPGERERGDAAAGQGADQVAGERAQHAARAVLPISARVRRTSGRGAENLRPALRRVRAQLRERHGACQDRRRVHAAAERDRALLGNSPEVGVKFFISVPDIDLKESVLQKNGSKFFSHNFIT